jgi:hypothetical protein
MAGEHHFAQIISDYTYVCPTYVEAYIYVKPIYLFDETAEICENEGIYLWHGQQLAESGVYWDSLQTMLNCDSIYRLQLTVHPSCQIDYQHIHCDNEPFIWRGRSITESGIDWDSLATIYGCDSLYRMEAVVNPAWLVITDTTICETENILWQGQNYDSTGIYATYYNSIWGCDSIHQLHLTVLPIITLDSVLTICEGESVNWGDYTAITTGTYPRYLVNAWHCDTVCLLHLTVNPVYQTDLYFTASLGDTIDYEGFSLTGDTVHQAGEYILQRMATNRYGCDSLIRLHLTVSGIAETEMPCVRLYPNPAKDKLTVESDEAAIKGVEVLDIAGRIIAVETGQAAALQYPVSVASLPQGIYLLKIRTEQGIATKKFVKN